MALDAYALCSLADYKTYRNPKGAMGTTRDTFYADLINAASAMIEGWLGRHILSRTYYEWSRAPNYVEMTVDEFPVITVQAMLIGSVSVSGLNATAGASAITVQRSASGVAAASVSVTPTGIVLDEWNATTGVHTQTSLLFATYPVTAMLTTAINLVSGWTAVKASDAPCAYLVPGSYEALTATALLGFASQRVPVTVKDADVGVLNISPSAKGLMVLTVYTAGYATVPYDVNQACKELATEFDRPLGTIKAASDVEGSEVWRNIQTRINHYRKMGVS